MEFVNGYPGGGGGGRLPRIRGSICLLRVRSVSVVSARRLHLLSVDRLLRDRVCPGYLLQPVISPPTPPIIQDLNIPADPLANLHPGPSGPAFPSITSPNPVIEPSSPEAQQNSLKFQAQGDEQLHLLNFLAASQRYRNAIDAARDRPQPRYRLAVTLAARSRFLEAVDQFKLSVAVDPTWPSHAERLDDLIGSRNTFEKQRIKTRVAEWTLQDPRDPNRLFLLAVFLHLEGSSESRQLLETADSAVWRTAAPDGVSRGAAPSAGRPGCRTAKHGADACGSGNPDANSAAAGVPRSTRRRGPNSGPLGRPAQARPGAAGPPRTATDRAAPPAAAVTLKCLGPKQAETVPSRLQQAFCADAEDTVPTFCSSGRNLLVVDLFRFSKREKTLRRHSKMEQCAVRGRKLRPAPTKNLTF